MNRLQARLDEEEFGLAEAPKESAVPPEAPKPEPSVAAVAPKQKKEATPNGAALKPEKTDEASEPPIESKKEDRKSPKSAEASEQASLETQIAKLGEKSAMTFEEKKKMRAARFKMEVVGPPTEEQRPNTRKRGNKERKEGTEEDNVGKGNKRQKKGRQTKEEKTKAIIESLSKEELEKRLERAKKYNVDNEQVAEMKAALRKFRFEK